MAEYLVHAVPVAERFAGAGAVSAACRGCSHGQARQAMARR